MSPRPADAGICGAEDLVKACLECMESGAAGSGGRAASRIMDIMGSDKWFSSIFGQVEDAQKYVLLARLWNSRALDDAFKRSFAGQAIKLCPALESVVGDRKSKRDEPPKDTQVTSWRSYIQRQEQLRKLIEETIPENSREIAVARSYGDLRENFEYQAARDRQRLLIRRRDELKNDLEMVRGTDFSGFDTSRCGPGTSVEVIRSDGGTATYTVLGVWDSDENLGIVSSMSAIAQALKGRSKGDEVDLPSGRGDSVERCRISSVGGLSADIPAWLAERNVADSGD